MSDNYSKTWTVKDWAEFFQVSQRTIWRYCDDPDYQHLNFPAPDLRESNFSRWLPGTAKNYIESLGKKPEENTAA